MTACLDRVSITTQILLKLIKSRNMGLLSRSQKAVHKVFNNNLDSGEQMCNPCLRPIHPDQRHELTHNVRPITKQNCDAKHKQVFNILMTDKRPYLVMVPSTVCVPFPQINLGIHLFYSDRERQSTRVSAALFIE